MLSLFHLPLCQMIGGQTCWTSQVGQLIGQRNIPALSSVECELSSLSHLTCVGVRQNMISLSPIIFVVSLLAEAIASVATADTGEVEEVLYKDANTVETFMRTREFKVSSSSQSHPQPFTPHLSFLGSKKFCSEYSSFAWKYPLWIVVLNMRLI